MSFVKCIHIAFGPVLGFLLSFPLLFIVIFILGRVNDHVITILPLESGSAFIVIWALCLSYCFVAVGSINSPQDKFRISLYSFTIGLVIHIFIMSQLFPFNRDEFALLVAPLLGGSLGLLHAKYTENRAKPEATNKAMKQMGESTSVE